MTELPSRAAIFTNCAEALDEAGVALSNARDWLRSDWTPVGSSLTDQAADAREPTQRATHNGSRTGPRDSSLRSLGGFVYTQIFVAHVLRTQD